MVTVRKDPLGSGFSYAVHLTSFPSCLAGVSGWDTMAILFNSAEQAFSLPSIPAGENFWLYNPQRNLRFDPNRVRQIDLNFG